ncbi:MAG: phosphotransferase [Actinopolymorphaceae bacterium]
MNTTSHRIEVVLWDPHRDAILVRTGSDAHGQGMHIVGVRDDGFGSAVPAAVKERFGIEAVLLEPLDIASYVLEAQTDASEAPPGGCRWLRADDATHLGPEPPGRLSTWLARRDKPLRPWFAPGWYERALAFADQELARLGIRRTGPAHQVKHWAISSVLRIPTTEGLVYLKTITPEGATEPALLHFLAEWWSHALPEVLAASDTDGMVLTADFGDLDGWKLPELERLDALTDLAEMQVALTSDVDTLLDLGLTRGGPRDLAERIPSLLGRTDLWDAVPNTHDHWHGLTDRQRETWLSLGPWLTERCMLLAETDHVVPLSLVHGDFHPGNIARRGDGFVLHDWTFAEVSHPFFDLARWLDDTSAKAACAYCAAYLARWPDPRVWSLAKPVAALYEIDKTVRMTDTFTSSHAYTLMAVVYGWVRRLLGAVSDPGGTIPNWR